jgi:hypothetical protein
MSKKRMTSETFVELAMFVHGDKYNYSQSIYLGANQKIEVSCPQHGQFWTTASMHVNGKHGCPVCWKERRGKSRLWTHSEYCEKLKSKRSSQVEVIEKV